VGLNASAYTAVLYGHTVVLVVFEDNTACIACVKGGGRTGNLKYLGKHPGIHVMWLGDLFESRPEEFRLEYGGTDLQIGDGFTKPLDGPAFLNFVRMIGIFRES